MALFMVEIRASHTGEGIFELRTGAWKKQQSREKLGSRQEAKRATDSAVHGWESVRATRKGGREAGAKRARAKVEGGG